MSEQVVGKQTQDLRKLFGQSDAEYRAFAVGFAAGQAEKVYLGVCKAAMFRPSRPHFDWFLSDVKTVAANYDLTVTVLDSGCPETPQEIWIHRADYEVGGWFAHELNSAKWHELRAAACGIPVVDIHYHKRGGYGERCD